MENQNITNKSFLYNEEYNSEEDDTMNSGSSKKTDKELLASLAPGFLDPLSPPRNNSSSFPFKSAIVSDMSEIVSLNSLELASYMEFQPALIKKAVEALRKMDQELIVKDDMLKSAEKVKDELGTCKHKLSESADVIERLRSEKSQVEIERQKYKVICDEHNEKVAYLEGMCAELSGELDKLNKKVTHLDLDKSKALTELEIYKSKCNELTEEVAEHTKYKVGLDDLILIENITPNQQLIRSQEHEEGEANKKRKLADEPPAMPYVQAKGYPTESESSDDSTESDSYNKVKKFKSLSLLSVPNYALHKSSHEADFDLNLPLGTDEEMVPASKLRKVQRSSGEESFGEVSMGMCHQCCKEAPALKCMHCKKLRYCFSCIKNWYPQMSDGDIETMCPCCRGNCHCRPCESRVGKSKEEIDLGVKLMDTKRVTYDLTRATIARYFFMPIEAAAKELNIGRTFFKRRCREVGITRWPYRKLMSLKSLIKTFRELELEEEVDKLKIRGQIEQLEEQMKLIMERPEIDVDEKTNKLRQACSKMNYKKR